MPRLILSHRHQPTPVAPTTTGPVGRSSTRGAVLALCTLLMLLAGIVLATSTASAGQADPPEKLFVEVRKSLLLDLGEKVETVSITDTELADFVVAAKTQVLIHGKKEGTTSLVVWTTGGQYKRYDLVVRRGYANKQIMLSVRVAEMTESAIKEFGIDYLARHLGMDTDQAVGVYSGQVSKPAIPLSAGTRPEFTDNTQIALRWIKGGENYEAIIHALAQDGLLRILARPNLVCLDGEEASFLAGGEFPIPVAQTSSIGGTTITIEWREFGVRLGFVPTIVDSTLINLAVKPEVSSLDFNNAVSIGGFVVPALQTRRASTHVELEDGESLVIGGLRSENERKVVKKIPVLGDIPLLGHLFKDYTRVTEENELLIVVSPTIVTPVDEGNVPLNPWERDETADSD